MKKLFFIIFIIPFSAVRGQTKNVENNITGVQVGLFGIDLYDEFRLSEKTTLRAEASLFPAIWGGEIYTKTGFAFYPALTLEPRFYYNLSRRFEKEKRTENNSANYFSLQFRYIPDWFVISNSTDLNPANQIQFIPTFGIRRTFGKNFNYEFNVGFGYGTTVGYENNISSGILDLGMKIGYDF